MPTFCTKCGTTIPDGIAVCPQCSTPVSVPQQAAQPQAVQPQAQAPQAQPQAAVPPMQQPMYQAPAGQPYPNQPYPQQGYPQAPYPQQGYPQQPYPNQPYPQQRYYGAQPNKASGMAKAFTIVSFVTGILSLFSAMSGMISLFISLTGTSSLLSPPDGGSLAASTFMFAIPGLVFGIIALIKKTRMLPMAIIGVIMNGSLAAVTLLTLFFETIL